MLRFRTNHTKHCSLQLRQLVFFVGLWAVLAAPAVAAVSNDSAFLKQALGSSTHDFLLARDPNEGFSLSGSTFSGRSSGMRADTERGISDMGLLTQAKDKFVELEGDRRVYALLIDGKYDFDFDVGGMLPFHPYLGGGLGVAMYEAGSSNLSDQDGAMVPLFRIGGGVVFKLGSDWDLSLNYKAGYTGTVTTGGSTFTGRGQEKIDLQSLDMGLKLKF